VDGNADDAECTLRALRRELVGKLQDLIRYGLHLNQRVPAD